MTAPDPRGRGLDPVHILGVVAQAASSGHLQAAHPAAEPGCYRVRLPSRRDARDASAALTRVGYQIAPDGTGHRALVVTGWSPSGLEARLTAMRAILCTLASEPAATGAAVIDGVRRLPAGSPADPDTMLAGARVQLRARVGARSGIHAPHNPAIWPADLGSALRLRAARALETAIDDLVERHLRVAGHALALFSSLRPQMSGDRARDTAIRQAAITFHLTGSPARDSAALLHGTVRPPSLSAPPAPRPASRPQAVPGQAAVREFPAPAARGGASPDPALPPMGRIGGRHLPASRPRPHR